MLTRFAGTVGLALQNTIAVYRKEIGLNWVSRTIKRNVRVYIVLTKVNGFITLSS